MTPDYEQDASAGNDVKSSSRSDAASHSSTRQTSRDDEYVDWSKTRRLAPERGAKTSNLIAFGVPFFVATLILLWYSLHARVEQPNDSQKNGDSTALRVVSPEENAAKTNDKTLENESANDGENDVQQDIEFVPYVEPIDKSGKASLPNLGAETTEASEGSGLANFNVETTDATIEDSVVEPSNVGTSDALEDVSTAELSVETTDATSEESIIDPQVDDGLIIGDDPTESIATTEPSDTLETLSPLEPNESGEQTSTQSDVNLPSPDGFAGDVLVNVYVTPEDEADPLPDAIESNDETASVDVSNALEDLTEPSLSDFPDVAETLDVANAENEEHNPTTDETAELDPFVDDRKDQIDEERETETRGRLAQIEFELAQIQNGDERDPDATRDAVEPLLAEAREIAENAPDALQDAANATATKCETFVDFLSENADFFKGLQKLDDAIGEKDARDAFFEQFKDAPREFDLNATPIERLKSEFARAGDAAKELDAVDEWNDFILARGEGLERFRAVGDDAQAALDFIAKNAKRVANPPEFKTMEKRVQEWRFDVASSVPAQRRIILMIEKEVTQKYWTYSPARNSVYYLPNPPRPGANYYVANTNGEVKRIDIPEGAAELKVEESPQKTILNALMKRAWQIPDSMRDEDPAKWYKEWCEFLKEMQKTEDLDPILQYTFLKDAAKTLAQSDFYFARRLEPILKVLDAPQLEEKSKLNRFPTENADTRALRDLALSRVKFLPMDHLEVDKTTEQLNAGIERFAFLYRRVGWLDRNFAGESRFRPSKDGDEIDGALYAFAVEDGAPRWYKIGVKSGRQVQLDFVAETIPTGSTVFCKTTLKGEPTVARRAALDELFNR